MCTVIGRTEVKTSEKSWWSDLDRVVTNIDPLGYLTSKIFKSTNRLTAYKVYSYSRTKRGKLVLRSPFKKNSGLPGAKITSYGEVNSDREKTILGEGERSNGQISQGLHCFPDKQSARIFLRERKSCGDKLFRRAIVVSVMGSVGDFVCSGTWDGKPNCPQVVFRRLTITKSAWKAASKKR
jgi:hypothetical protein